MDKGVTFIHKTDNGEYIEIPLSNNSSARIYGFSYNDIIGESSDYCVDINGDELCLKESEVLMHLEEIEGDLSNKDKYTLENATYINHEKNWLLQETRIFDDENDGAMIESYLQVLDMSNNMAQVEDEMLDNDVWSVGWDKINSFTKKINKF